MIKSWHGANSRDVTSYLFTPPSAQHQATRNKSLFPVQLVARMMASQIFKFFYYIFFLYRNDAENIRKILKKSYPDGIYKLTRPVDRKHFFFSGGLTTMS